MSKVEYRNPKCFLPKEEMYIGGQATALLSSRECALTAEQSQFFRLRCLDFYIESVDQILKWIPFQKSVLRHLELLDPAVCMNGSAASTAPLAQAFPNLVSGKAMQALDPESIKEMLTSPQAKNLGCTSSAEQCLLRNTVMEAPPFLH